MKNYLLMHKNIVVAGFTLDGSEEVINLFIAKHSWQHLPLPLKRIIHFNGYIESERNNTLTINEEGVGLFEIWLHDRTIPSDRHNKNRYIPKGISTLAYMLNNHSCSLVDCYWTKEVQEDINWDTVKLYNNKKIDRLSVIENSREQGEIYSGINSTLGGSLEKYWYYSEYNNKKQLMLAKRTYSNSEILNIREVIASKIYEKQQYKNHCKYSYIRNTSEGIIVGCKCKAFTSEQDELITVYGLLEEIGQTQTDDIYNVIIQRAAYYGANPHEVRNQLDIQTLVDYLITNRDRHQNNIGFIRDPDTLRIKQIAPIFDSGSSMYLEGELPESVEYTTVHNLYNTEIECINSVSNINIINLDKLPSNSWVLNELKKAQNLSAYRINKLYCLYKDKVDYIRYLQNNKNIV